MNRNTYGLIILALTGLLAAANPADEAARSRESQIKAAFLYNFVRFTEWPAGKVAEPNSIIIGLLGEHRFQSAFDTVKDKPIKDKKLIIRDFGKFEQLHGRAGSDKDKPAADTQQLGKCHLLFICDSESDHFKQILEGVKDCNVLTVGETAGFLDAGGIISFIPGAEKPVFEVNLIAARRAGLQISSRLLRLAQKVIAEQTPGVNHNE